MRAAALACLAALAACAPTANGPNEESLRGLIASARPGTAPEIDRVRCDFIAEEGSEWRCRYRQKASDGRWVPLETYVAMDGDGWVLIDEAANPDGPSAS
jgi:hypothetical protein